MTVEKEKQKIQFESRSIGNPENPTIIIIIGTGASLNWGLIDRDLEKRGFHVITYNARDSFGNDLVKNWDLEGIDWSEELKKAMAGQPFKAPYDWNDQADDAITVLNSYNIEKANIIGASTGGTIAQIILTRHANRFNSATFIASGYTFDIQDGYDSPERREYMQAVANLPPMTSESPVETYIERQKVAMGMLMECTDNDPRFENLKIAAEDDFKKGWIDFTGMGDPRSYLACFKWLPNIERHHEALKNNEVPSLVIHGEKDPMVPFEQGKMLAANLKNTTFKPHKFGHILGPLNEQNKMLDMISDFINKNN